MRQAYVCASANPPLALRRSLADEQLVREHPRRPGVDRLGVRQLCAPLVLLRAPIRGRVRLSARQLVPQARLIRRTCRPAAVRRPRLCWAQRVGLACCACGGRPAGVSLARPLDVDGAGELTSGLRFKGHLSTAHGRAASGLVSAFQELWWWHRHRAAVGLARPRVPSIH